MGLVEPSVHEFPNSRDTEKVNFFMGARRSILLAGAFAALLLVIGVSATAVWWNARTAQANLADLHDVHMRANAALAAIRADVYLTGILTRDYLLDASSTAADPQYINQFNGIREDTERNFEVIEQTRQDEEQRAALATLKREIRAQYWEPTVEALAWTPQEKAANRGNLLSKLVKRRQEVVSLAAQVEQLIATNFLTERQRAATASQAFRSSFGWIMSVTLLLGLAISGVALTRMNALERQSREAESELRRLSGQIRMAQEEERKHLSRELHDEVGQLLTGLRMELASMARLDDPSERALRLESSKRTVEQLIGSIRNITLLLRPSMLDDLGLAAALGWLIKESSRTSSIEIRAKLDTGADSLPEAHRTCLYRVVQEALTNVARHSGARRAEVVVQTEAGWVIASITDDGRGFHPELAKGLGLGLIGMEERVKELGGGLHLASSPGRGARVEVHLPRTADVEVLSAKSVDSGRSRDRSSGFEASA